MDCEMEVAGEEMTPRQDNDFQALVQQAGSDNPEIQLQAVKQIRSAVTSTSPHAIATALISGALPTLIHLLNNNSNFNLQGEAAWTITSIAAGSSNNRHAVVQAGAVPILISLLSSQRKYLREHAVWTLGKIVGDGPATRDYVFSMGIAQPLFSLINTDTSTRYITWTISNICRYSPLPPKNFIQEVILHATSFLNHKDIGVLKDTLWALHDISQEGIEQTEMIIGSEVCLPKLVGFLSHEDITVMFLALGIIGNIVVHSQTQAVLDCGALKYFPNLLTFKNFYIRKDAAWFLSNIVAGTLTEIQEVIDAQLIPLVINELESGKTLDKNELFSTEFACIVRNIGSHVGNEEQVSYLIGIRVLPPLCKLLSTTQSVVLKGMVNDAVRSLLFKIRAEDVEQARSQISESIGPDRVDEFLQSIQCQGFPQNLQPIRRRHQEADTGGAGDVDDVLQNFQRMKLDF